MISISARDGSHIRVGTGHAGPRLPLALDIVTTIRLRSTASASVSGTTLSCNKPADASVGDVLVASWATRADVLDANMDLPSGWVQVAYNAVTQPTHKLAYKVVGASEPSSYDFVMASSVAHSVAILCYRGVDVDNVSDVTATTNSGTSGTTLTATGLTTATPGAMLIAAFANHVVTATAISDPTDMDERVAVTAQCRNTVSELLTGDEGASGDKTATQASTARWSAILWALRPLNVISTADITVSVAGTSSRSTSMLPGVSLITNPPLWGEPGWANAKTSLNLSVGAYKTHIYPFGLLDPWNSDTNGPTEANPSLWGTGNRLSKALTEIQACDAAAPIVLTLYSAPWWMKHSLFNNVLTDLTYADRFSDDGRLKYEYLPDWLVMVDEAVTLAAAEGCRDFEVWNEAKGFYDVYPHVGQTWDSSMNSGNGVDNIVMGYGYFFQQTATQIVATMTGLGHARGSYRIGIAYPVLSTKPTQTSDSVPSNHPLYAYRNQWGYANKAPINFTLALLDYLEDGTIDPSLVDVLTLDTSTFIQNATSGQYPSADPFAYTEKFTHISDYWQTQIATRNLNLVIDYGEAYGFPPPALQTDGQEALRAALWADVYKRCAWSGVRYVLAWGPIGEAQGASNSDESGLITDPGLGAGAGQLTLVGDVAQAFKDNFPPGTQLFEVTTGDTRLDGLASATKLLLYSKSASPLTVSVAGVDTAFDAYELKVIDR